MLYVQVCAGMPTLRVNVQAIGGHWVSHPVAVSLAPLRQGLLVSLELWFQFDQRQASSTVFLSPTMLSL